MNRLLRSFGSRMTAVILLLSGVWVVGMILGPQLIMVEQSFWYTDRGGEAAVISVQIDRHYNDIDMLSFDKMDAEALAPSQERDAKIAEIEAAIAEKQAVIAELEAREIVPKKVYSLRNYMLMGPNRARQILRTAGTGHDAQRDLGLRKSCIVARIQKIQCGGYLTTATIGSTVHCPDDRRRAVDHCPDHAFKDAMLVTPGLIVHTIAFFEIATGAERLCASAGNHDTAGVARVLRQIVEKSQQISPHLRVQRIGRFGPIQGNQQHLRRHGGQKQRVVFFSCFRCHADSYVVSLLQ